MLGYREHAAAPELRRLIECVWVARDARARRARPRDRIIPDACPELIVHLGDPFRRLVDGRWRVQPHAFLAGTLSRPWHLRAGARIHTLGIRFRPAALTRVFAFDMSRATDREIPLVELAGKARAGELLAGLAACANDAGRNRAAQRWLAACVEAAPAPGEEWVSRATRVVLVAHGRIAVAELAARLGISRRRLERGFARHLGIRPKLFARIVRLQGALASLGESERGRAVDWALDAGYFDQAHLARDFRALAGRPASRRREEDGELARNFSDPTRLIALLADA